MEFLAIFLVVLVVVVNLFLISKSWDEACHCYKDLVMTWVRYKYIGDCKILKTKELVRFLWWSLMFVLFISLLLYLPTLITKIGLCL